MSSEEVLTKSGIDQKFLSLIRKALDAEQIELNPMQKDFVEKGLLKKDRIIISTQTASGKTLLAYLKFFYEASKGNATMVYLVPYSRIVKEKVKELKSWEDVGLRTTSDFKAYQKEAADILVSTYASIDNAIRRGGKPKANIFVFDEIDMMTDYLQGTTVEGAISRILRESAVEKVYALSATIGSPELLEKWLNAQTFHHDWRPGKLIPRVELYSSDKEETQILEEIFVSEMNEKKPMLVFYYNTRYCRDKAKQLAKYRESLHGTGKKNHEAIHEISEKCAPTREVKLLSSCLANGIGFYYSMMQPSAKAVVENLFEKKPLDVVFTTPALARGVNLPVRTVIIPTPYKYTRYGMSLISRSEVAQIFGRACRPPFQKLGYGIIPTSREEKKPIYERLLDPKSEKMSSTFLQSHPNKGRILNNAKLAIEIIKEIRMRHRSSEEIQKMFDTYLFAQEIPEKTREVFYERLKGIVNILTQSELLDRNIDGDFITTDVVDIVIDSGIDDLKRMICIKNISDALLGEEIVVDSGFVAYELLSRLCKSYSYKIGMKKDADLPRYLEKIKQVIIDKCREEPSEVGNPYKLFVSIVLYTEGHSLDEIEGDYGLYVDSVPYLASNVVSRDFHLLARLIEKQSMGDKEKLKLCEYLDLFSKTIEKGLPYCVLPLVETIDGIGQRIALRILEKYNNAPSVLKMLSKPEKVRQELPKIEGIGKILTDRVVEKRKDLIANLQKKITCWGNFTSAS